MERLMKLFLGLLVGLVFMLLPKGLSIVLWGALPVLLWQIFVTLGFVLVLVFSFYILKDAFKVLRN